MMIWYGTEDGKRLKPATRSGELRLERRTA